MHRPETKKEIIYLLPNTHEFIFCTLQKVKHVVYDMTFYKLQLRKYSAVTKGFVWWIFSEFTNCFTT